MSELDPTLAVNVDTANQISRSIFAPWLQQLGMVVESIDSSGAVMRLPYSEQLCRAGGMVCGQAMLALIDTCMVYVAFAAQNQYGNCTTVSQTTNFVRAAMGQDIIARGTIVKRGRQLLFGEVVLTTAEDAKTVATGSATYMLLP
ncbi:MAG: PaaI family thioesterase [Porticoccaceae bacterium]